MTPEPPLTPGQVTRRALWLLVLYALFAAICWGLNEHLYPAMELPE